MSAGEVTLRCPECGAEIRYDPRFTPWCADCEWNVDPLRPAGAPSSRLERRRRELARRHGERLLGEIAGGTPLKPRRDLFSVLAQLMAVAVHGVTLVLAALGVWLIAAGLGVPLLLVGLLLLGIAVVLAPRVVRLPDDVPVLARDDAPELFRLVDDVAAVVGTRGVDRIAVDADLNASVRAYGLLGRRLLTIGAPLWEVLSPPERVALLGHELGHFANGDVRHIGLVWSAARALGAWSRLVAPAPGDRSWWAGIVNVVAYPPWLAVEGIRMLLDTLTMRAAQRGEYLADRFAGTAGGTEGATGLMDKLLMGSFVATTLGRERSQQAIRPSRDALRERAEGLWARLAAEVRSIPDEEVERLRRAGVRRGHAVDSTHPPTHLRRVCLSLASPVAPAVVIDADREARIETELSAARRTIATRYLDGSFD